MNIITVPQTVLALRAAERADREGRKAEAMLHINAACYWSMSEMPDRAHAIRAQAERYRTSNFQRRA